MKLSAKLMVKIIAGLFYWPGMIWLWVKFGWELPVGLFFVIIGTVLNYEAKKM